MFKNVNIYIKDIKTQRHTIKVKGKSINVSPDMTGIEPAVIISQQLLLKPIKYTE